MAKVLRGKLKGQNFTISQYCNDWVTVKEIAKVFSITSLEFTIEEMFTILNHENLGMMLQMFEVIPHQNRFRRKRRNRC